jgi:hypothetical protein
MLATLIKGRQPDRLVCALDLDWRPAWRVKLIDSYKTHRLAPGGEVTGIEEVPDPLEVQVPVILEILDAFGIAAVGALGCEADDVIGTVATREPGPVEVATGDRDLFQLIDDDKPVRILYCGRGVAKLEVFDDAVVRTKYGIPAANYADFAALRGDPERRAAGSGRHRGEDGSHGGGPPRRPRHDRGRAGRSRLCLRPRRAAQTQRGPALPRRRRRRGAGAARRGPAGVRPGPAGRTGRSGPPGGTRGAVGRGERRAPPRGRGQSVRQRLTGRRLTGLAQREERTYVDGRRGCDGLPAVCRGSNALGGGCTPDGGCGCGGTMIRVDRAVRGGPVEQRVEQRDRDQDDEYHDRAEERQRRRCRLTA